jgi:lipoprotein-anchoring transpeptidase ErfK/SrfK
VRLTNWDAERLAQSLKKGVEVVFVDGKQAAR